MKTEFPTGGWRHVSKQAPCPACKRADWCTVSADGLVVKCMRVPSKRCVKQSDGQPAWLHPINTVGGYDLSVARPVERSVPRLKLSDLKSKLREFRQSLTTARLKAAAVDLGLSEQALKAYGIGWCGKPESYSFPMVGGDGKPCGIRLRRSDGKKLCVVGSRNGLFVPADYEAKAIHEGICDDPFPLLLLLPEGPTDAAAAFDLGFRAIGRPSNAGGAKQLTELLAGGDKQDVVIVADRDPVKIRPDGKPFWPGIEGALGVCEMIEPVCGRLRFLMPPDNAKDLREWLSVGSHGHLLASILAAPVVTRKWIYRAKMRIEQRRSEFKQAG